jgi:hypothetical protein
LRFAITNALSSLQHHKETKEVKALNKTERRIRYFKASNKRAKKGIKRYKAIIKELWKTAHWIEEHKISKPLDFYSVIQAYETWKKSLEQLIKSNNEHLAELRG